MIVPMKKVSLIILEDKKQETLMRLRKLGLVHIEITEADSSKIDELRSQTTLLEHALVTLGKAAGKKLPPVEASFEDTLSVAQRLASLEQEIKNCQAERISLTAELEKLSSWGEIDPQWLEYLAEKGMYASLYEMPASEYKRLDADITTLVCKKTRASVKFLAIKANATAEEPDALKGYKVILPQRSTSAQKARVADIEQRISQIEKEILSYGNYGRCMKNALKTIEKQIEFETYASGMTNESLSAVSVSYFTGYIEAERLAVLRSVSAENSWGLVVEEPTEEDNVPTKLKNNKFVSLIYPLMDFLGTVPGYFEYDISAWFLGFILIFFGIIFGDGGYGIIICGAATALIIATLAAKKKVSPAFWLVELFGLSTILWGMLTCTWFGLAPEQLPLWLQKLSLPIISNVYADKIWYPFWTNGSAGLTTAQNLQIFCFSLALIQLTVAHIKGAARNRKSLKALGDIGSILQLFGIYYFVLSLVVNAQVFSFGLVIGKIPVGIVAVALVGVGFVISFVFSNYQGSIVKSVLESLKNIVSVLLGVVNVFSDIVSYIRLWAVGLAGAAISATVNELVAPFLGNLLFAVIVVVLLVFGHGLNMILNVLSVIVHGIRLNTLEFSSHLDMSWSGHKFKPFEE